MVLLKRLRHVPLDEIILDADRSGNNAVKPGADLSAESHSRTETCKVDLRL